MVYHGDIKAQNIMITSFNWIYLTDFSSVKPTFLPEDNPIDFSFFFDNSSSRACYVAPERFVNSNDSRMKKFNGLERDNYLGYEMDIFSLGCLLIELFNESKPTFTLSQLLKYKKGDYDVTSLINKISCKHIQLIVKSMIDLNPLKRNTCEYYIKYLNENFEIDFEKYYNLFLKISKETMYLKDKEHFHVNDNPSFSIQSVGLNLDNRIHLFYQIKSELLDSKHIKVFYIVIFSSIVSSLYMSLFTSSKLMLIELLEEIENFMNDDERLDLLLPYLVNILKDSNALVKINSLKLICKILNKIVIIKPINYDLFIYYLWPNFSTLIHDSSAIVRATYANFIGSLIEISFKFYSLSINNAENLKDNQYPMMTTKENLIEPILYNISQLLIDYNLEVKLALLNYESISKIVLTLGINQTNDLILSHIITYLNDFNWKLRSSFFDCIKNISLLIGIESLEEYILPLMSQSLNDEEEFVIVKVVECYTQLVYILNNNLIFEISKLLLPFTQHPNIWIRFSSINYFVVVIKKMSLMDFNVWILPILSPLFKINFNQNVNYFRINFKDFCLKEDAFFELFLPYINRSYFQIEPKLEIKDEKIQKKIKLFQNYFESRKKHDKNSHVSFNLEGYSEFCPLNKEFTAKLKQILPNTLFLQKEGNQLKRSGKANILYDQIKLKFLDFIETKKNFKETIELSFSNPKPFRGLLEHQFNFQSTNDPIEFQMIFPITIKEEIMKEYFILITNNKIYFLDFELKSTLVNPEWYHFKLSHCCKGCTFNWIPSGYFGFQTKELIPCLFLIDKRNIISVIKINKVNEDIQFEIIYQFNVEINYSKEIKMEWIHYEDSKLIIYCGSDIVLIIFSKEIKIEKYFVSNKYGNIISHCLHQSFKSDFELISSWFATDLGRMFIWDWRIFKVVKDYQLEYSIDNKNYKLSFIQSISYISDCVYILHYLPIIQDIPNLGWLSCFSKDLEVNSKNWVIVEADLKHHQELIKKLETEIKFKFTDIKYSNVKMVKKNNNFIQDFKPLYKRDLKFQMRVLPLDLVIITKLNVIIYFENQLPIIVSSEGKKVMAIIRDIKINENNKLTVILIDTNWISNSLHFFPNLKLSLSNPFFGCLDNRVVTYDGFCNFSFFV